METFGIIFVFVVMLAAPCIIALRSSGRQKSGNDPYGETYEEQDRLYESDQVEDFPAYLPEAMSTLPVDRPLTLSELATRAENDARIAQELAHEAHYAAVSAAAYAARLRADAAIEAAQLAEKAMRDTPFRFDGEYLVTQAKAIETKQDSRAA